VSRAFAGIGPALAAALLLAALAGGALAHPALEREPHHPLMKGPGALSARRLPLSAHPVKTYLPAKAEETPGTGAGVFQGLLAFYRTVISPVDGDRCVMAPTCSLYSHQAIREHGVWMGILLTADRLLHEGDEIPRVPRIKERGETLYLDPLEANTYWWPDWLK
jgi:hypothetical protein